MKSSPIFPFVIFLFFYLNALTQPFELDSNFGENGIVHLNLFGEDDNVTSIITQENGKLVLSFSNMDRYGIVRFQQNGSIDTDFGDNGKAIADFEQLYTFGRRVATQPDGKLVMVGYVKDSSKIHYIALARFLTDGTLDKNFGNKGKIITNYIETATSARDIVIQPDGKVIVAGKKSYSPFNSDFILFRFNEDGTLDKKFGNNGIVYTSFGSKIESARFVKLQSDRKILVGGYVEQTKNDYDFAVGRYHPDGSLDNTFGSGGKITFDFNNGFDDADYMVVQPNGKIIIGGSTITAGGNKEDIALVRFNIDGALDTTYGNHGKVVTDLSGSDNIVFQTHDLPSSILLRPDGKLLVAGSTYVANSFNRKRFIAQYTENGILDKDFGNNGVYINDSSDGISLRLLALQSDGKILHAGRFTNSNNSDLYLIRYLTDLNVGTLNFSLNNNSILVYPNPIQQTATLAYTLENPESLTIQLIALNGKIIKTFLQNEMQKAGEYQQQIDLPVALAEGVYFLRLTSLNGQVVVKVVK